MRQAEGEDWGDDWEDDSIRELKQIFQAKIELHFETFLGGIWLFLELTVWLRASRQ